MSESLSIAEAAARYGAAITNLQEPLILEHEGQPLAVVISFQEYQRLRFLEVEKTQRQQKSWLELDALLTQVHNRPTEYAPEQIEAEISMARAEVREKRRARRSG